MKINSTHFDIRLILASILFLAVLSAEAEIIPTNRVMVWTPGIPGGIPSVTNIFCDVTVNIPGTNIVAVGDGVADDYPAINAAINLCPSGQVVYLPAGRFRISTRLYFPYKDNFVLRGAGSSNTTIAVDFSNGTYAVWLGTSEGPPVPTNRIAKIGSGYTAGSTNISLLSTNGIGLAVGRFLLINQSNDNVMVTSRSTSEGTPCTYADRDRNGTRNLQQLVRITGIDGTNVTFEPPLYWTYDAALDPEAAVLIYTLDNVGIESLKIENVTNATYCIYISHANRCWVKDVETLKAWNYHFFLYYSVESEIRGCRFHSSDQPEKTYGFEARNSTALLFENNIIDDVMAPFQLNSGSAGCVIGYNYITHIRNLDPTMGKVTMNGCHGAHPMFNLFEGNIAPRFQSDSYWGSCSHLTLFRNHFLGTDDDVTHNRIAISIDRNCWYHNIVGNILGDSSITNWGYETSTDGHNYNSNLIYRLGYPNMGNNAYSNYGGGGWGDYDTNVENTILRHGNYDYANGNTVWDGDIADTNLPDSYYLTNKPAWWGDGAWPPIGPDLLPMVSTIPAYTRTLNPPHHLLPIFRRR